jgi:SH3-like domain-containing protein
MFSAAFCRTAVVSLLLLTAAIPVAAEPEGSGLPLPRYVSLRADEVNMRIGPGKQYPIDWVYQRRGLPMEVVAEYYTWRRVRDWRGAEGWIHSSMLSGRRSFIVTGEMRTLMAEPTETSPRVAIVEPGVVGNLLECQKDKSWCRVEVEGFNGWLRREDFWGVHESEVVE